MTKTTLSEETQELLDEVYDVELANEFIENHGETEFLTYYEKYEELVREYGRNLIDEFAEHYDVDSVEHLKKCIKDNLQVVENLQSKFHQIVDMCQEICLVGLR